MNSTNVENNIVRMQFDNAAFEKNVSKTMTTLDKLKEALHFKDASKGLNNLTSAMEGVKFNPLLEGIQQVHNKFTLLDSFTINMFNRITNAAIEAGKKITSALTIDPIKTGFTEYEQKMNAIQVIAANTGALNSGMEDAGKSVSDTMQALHDIWAGRLGNGQQRFDVLDAMGFNHENVQSHINEMAYGGKTYKDIENALVSGGGGTSVKHIEDVLNELNLYADKTIYNFTQMTQAIGQFTTAGVDVDTAATSVKGIANLAAYVGAPASDASRAMFQLSQALSTGRVRLQDWMSLEHTAGMGGKVFQDALIDTAEHFGIAAKAAIEAEGSFRESLKHDWLTTDVLNETLKKLSGDFDELYWAQQGYTQAEIQSIMDLGRVATESATKVRTVSMMWDAMKEAAQSTWTETWQYIIGGYEDAPKLLTAINDSISELLGNMNASRNAALKFWYNAKLGGRSDWFRVEEHTERVKEYVNVLDEAGNIKKEFQDSVTKDENGILWMDGEMLEDGTIERWKKAIGKNGKELTDASGNILYETQIIKRNAGIIVDLWHYVLEIAEPIKAAFEDTFDTGLREALTSVTVFMRNFTQNLVNSRKPIEELYYTFSGIFSIIKMVLHVGKSVATLFWNIVKRVVPTASTGILGLTGAIGKFLTKSGGLERILDVIDTIFWNLDNTVGAFVGDTLFNLVSLINDLLFSVPEITSDVSGALNVASGFFKVLEVGQHILMAIGGIGFALIDKLFPKLARVLFNTASSIGEMAGTSDILDTMIAAIDNFATLAIDWINHLDENLHALIDTFVTFVKETTGIDLYAVWDFVIEKATALWNILKEIDWRVIFAPFVAAYNIFKEGVEKAETLPDRIKAIKDALLGFFDEFGNKFGETGEKIKQFFDELWPDTQEAAIGGMEQVGPKIGEFLKAIGITDAQSAAKLGGLIAAIAGLIKIIIDVSRTTGGVADIVESFSGMFEGFSDILDNTADAIDAFTKSLQANSIFKIAAAIGILTLSIIAMSLIPEDKLEHALSMLISMFTGLFFILKQLTGLIGGLTGFLSGAGGGIGLGVMMAGIGIAIIDIVGAMIVLSTMDPEVMGAALAAMYTISLILKTIMKSFVGIAPGALKGVASTMISLAAVIWVVSGVIKSLTKLIASSEANAEAIKTSAGIVAGIAAGMLVMIIALGKLALIPDLNFGKIGTTLLLMSVAIGIIAGSIVAIMAGITAFTKITGDAGQALNLLIISTGVIIVLTGVIAGILIVLSKFPIAVISGVAGTVAVLTLCIGAMVAMVAGLAALTAVVPPGQLWVGVKIIAALAFIVTVMYGLIVVINRMSAGIGSIGALIALGAVITAIASMAAIVSMLSLIPEENLYRAMSALEGISLAVALLIGVTALLVGVTTAALPAIGPTLKYISLAFLSIAASGALFAATIWLIVDAIRNGWALIQDFSVNGAQVMSDFAEQLNGSLDSFGEILVKNIPRLAAYFLAGLTDTLTVVATYTPILGFKFTQILVGILMDGFEALAAASAGIVRGLVWIVAAINQELEPLIDALVDTLIILALGLGNSLANKSEEFADAIMMLIVGILLVVGQTFRKLGSLLYDIFKPVIDFLVGWWNYMVDFWVSVWQSIDNAKTKAKDTIVGFFQTVRDNISGFFLTIALKIANIRKKISDFKDALIKWVQELPQKFIEGGKNIVSGVVKGVQDKLGLTDNIMVNFAQRLINAFSGPKGINSNSPSKVFEEFGQYIVDGVNLGVEDGMPNSLSMMEGYADDMTGTFGHTMSTGLTALFADNNLLNGSLNLSTEGSAIGESLGIGMQNGLTTTIGAGGMSTMAYLTPVLNGDNLSMNNILDQYLGSGYGEFSLNGKVTGIDGLNQFSANIQNSIDQSRLVQDIKTEINMLRGEINMFNQAVAAQSKQIVDSMGFDVYISPDKLVGATKDEIVDAVALEISRQSRSGG